MSKEVDLIGRLIGTIAAAFLIIGFLMLFVHALPGSIVLVLGIVLQVVYLKTPEARRIAEEEAAENERLFRAGLNKLLKIDRGFEDL